MDEPPQPSQDEKKLDPGGSGSQDEEPRAAEQQGQSQYEAGDVPDPDEDDLDDLDGKPRESFNGKYFVVSEPSLSLDMLDDFSAVKIDPKTAPVESTSPNPPTQPKPAAKNEIDKTEPLPEDALSEDDFANQLQAGMADLLGELEKSVGAEASFEYQT